MKIDTRTFLSCILQQLFNAYLLINLETKTTSSFNFLISLEIFKTKIQDERFYPLL
jgi:hypothetical protein